MRSVAGAAPSAGGLKRIRPLAMRPGGWTSRMIDSAVTDLPLPDSPTRPSVSPRAIWKLMLSTATASTGGPLRRRPGSWKTVVRPETWSSGASGMAVTILAKDLPQRVGDFAECGARLDGRDDRRHEVGAARCRRANRIDRALPGAGIARGTQGRHGRDLTPLAFGVNSQKVNIQRVIRLVAVYADDDLFATVDRL